MVRVRRRGLGRSMLGAGLLVLALVAGPFAPPTGRADATLALAGKVVTLDPGHNGGNAAHLSLINKLVYAGNGLWKPCNTVGTATRAGYAEHALTWDVANRTAGLLRAMGAKVVFTRTSDVGVGPCVNVRPAIGNQTFANAVVAIHADGSYTAGARGFHVIYPGASTTPYAVRQSSWRLALKLRAAYAGIAGVPYANYIAGGDALQSRSDLGGLNLTKRPTVFIEMGNMKNATDAAIMASAAGRQRLAKGIAAGIAAFLTS